MGAAMKHRLIQDCDGHWYVIRVGLEAEFEKWVERQATCSSPGSAIDFSDARVDGPHVVSFDHWERV